MANPKTDQGTVGSTLTISDLSPKYDTFRVRFEFYTSSAYTTRATPTAGSVKTTASEDGVDYGNVSTVDVSTTEYTRPVAWGPITEIKCAPVVAITGNSVSHWKAIVTGYRSMDPSER